MNKIIKQFIDIFVRYGILILVALPNLWIFYFIFTPLTIYPAYFLFGLIFDSFLIGNIIFIEGFPVEIIKACVVGSAYYLLLILNLSVPKIKFQKRIKMIGFSFIFLLIINILRIFFLGTIFISNSSWFDISHKLFWNLGSVVFVIGIWFVEVKLFKIKGIPFYSDFRFLYKKSKIKW